MQALTAPDPAARWAIARVGAPGRAGRDPAGRAWSRRYYPAALHAVRALAALARCVDIDDVPPARRA